jgi:hypothetical protein
MEGVALIYFGVNQMYQVSAFITAKWIISLIWFLIEYTIVKHKERLNADGGREYDQ